MTQTEMNRILEMGVLLSAERDLNRLLEEIVSCAMELARCDGGTLYLREDDVLRFRITRTDSLGVAQGGDGKLPDIPPVPLERSHVCAFSFLENRTVCIEDVYDAPDYDFSGPRRYDAQNHYRTRSMLVVPMRNREGEVLGVLQLINALDEGGNVCPFSPEMTLMLESLASQAAITIQNVRYIREIKELFWSFIRVMSVAIEERAKYNAYHSQRMARNGERFLRFLNGEAAAKGEPIPYPPQKLEEMVMSIWLHDIGKVTTPLEVMDKAERLLPEQKTAIAHRMETIRLLGKIACLEGRITGEELSSLEERTRAVHKEILRISKDVGFVGPDLQAWIEELSKETWQDEAGKLHPWLEPEEKRNLSILKGTLNDDERQEMSRHAVITGKLLSQISFPKELANIPVWAPSHHEFLNGTGYPRQLKEEEIPREVRIITILDIFDALIDDTRPYKDGMPVERALSILESMAKKEGKLDPELVELFIQSKAWEPEEE